MLDRRVERLPRRPAHRVALDAVRQPFGGLRRALLDVPCIGEPLRHVGDARIEAGVARPAHEPVEIGDSLLRARAGILGAHEREVACGRGWSDLRGRAARERRRGGGRRGFHDPESFGRAPAPIDDERRRQPARRRETHPQARRTLVARDVNEPGGDGGCESTEECGRQAVGERESGRAHVRRHHLGERHDHRPVVARVQERQPQFRGEHLLERRRGDEPREHRVRGEDRECREQQEERAPADAIGQRAHHGQPDEVRRTDAERDHQASAAVSLSTVLPNVGV